MGGKRASVTPAQSLKPHGARSPGLFSFIVNFVQFLFYRTLHLWEESSKYARLCIKPHNEVKSSLIGYIIRYLILPANAAMTYFAIKAQQDDDQTLFRTLIYWGFVPAAIRTVAAMWSSTIDRQFAKDQEQRNNVFVDLINVQRRALGHSIDRRGGGCCMYRIYKLVPGVDHPDARRSDTVRSPQRKLRLYRVLAAIFERPINYGVQKVTVAILLFLWFYPDGLGDDSLEIAVVCRYIRIITTCVLAPLNHYLGDLRRHAMLEVRDEYLAIFMTQTKQLQRTTPKKGLKHSKKGNKKSNPTSGKDDVDRQTILGELVSGTQEGDTERAMHVVSIFEKEVENVLDNIVSDMRVIVEKTKREGADASDEDSMFLDNTDVIRDADRFYVKAREAHRWAHSCQQVISEAREACHENGIPLATLSALGSSDDDDDDDYTSFSNSDDSTSSIDAGSTLSSGAVESSV